MRARVSRTSDAPVRRGTVLTRDVRDPALAYVEPPPSLRVAAGAITLLFLLLALLLLLVPWRQSAIGSGQVIAYAPAAREQVVDAPVDGRLDSWLVTEGDQVTQGQPLVQILDNDPDRLPRLERQRIATEAEQQAVLEQLVQYEGKVASLGANREFVAAEYDSKIAKLRQNRVADQAALEAAELNRNRTETLSSEGLASQRSREVADMKWRSAAAKLEARDAEIAAERQARSKALAEVDIKLASGRAELEAARTKYADVERKLIELDTKLARQNQQLVRAPRDGTVLRFYGGPGGGQVKKGDALLQIVPNVDDRAVELFIDGNDMPFVWKGAEVRLVFEGWPALQVVGLPGANTGTFAGRVAFIDATDNGKGKFRVVVVPDSDADPWPEFGSLRQGVRAKGWIMLNQVMLGYELWRQINGFPPLPDIEKGDNVPLPSAKKPRIPSELK